MTAPGTSDRSSPSSTAIACRIRAQNLRLIWQIMRYTEFGLTTLKETPAEAEIVSHQLMLRAGLIRRLASGLFTWLPLGLRVLRKVERIVREEMDRAGALEILMPAVQTRGALAGIGTLGQVRLAAAAHERPPRAGLLLWSDPRGSRHRSGETRTAQLQAAAGQFLPDSDEVSRRNSPPVWRHACARIRHEGRLLVRSQSGRPGSTATGACTTPTRPSSADSASSSAWSTRTAERSAAAAPRNST